MSTRGNTSRVFCSNQISFSVAILLIAAAPSWAGATLEQSLLSPESMCASSGNDGRDELQAMLDRVRNLKGYSYDSVLTTYTGGKKIVEIGKLYFKSPNLMRFEVIKSGSRSGAVVVKQPDGKIRGHMGGVFRGIKVTLSPDSKILKSANGFSIMQADLESLLTGVAKKAKGDFRCLALTPGSGRPVVVELLESDGDVEDRIAVDSRAKLPSEWNIFNSNKLVSALQLNNVQERNDLSDDFFSLSKDGESKSLLSFSLSTDSGLGALQASSDRGIDVATCKDIERLIKQMAYLSDQIPNTTVQGDTWSDGTRETLLSTCAELEVLEYALRPVRTAIDNTKANVGSADGASSADGANGAGGTGAPSSPIRAVSGGGLSVETVDGIAAQWNTSASSFRKALDELLEQLTNDQPDSAVVKNAVSSLKSSVNALRAASERVQELI